MNDRMENILGNLRRLRLALTLGSLGLLTACGDGAGSGPAPDAVARGAKLFALGLHGLPRPERPGRRRGRSRPGHPAARLHQAGRVPRRAHPRRPRQGDRRGQRQRRDAALSLPRRRRPPRSRRLRAFDGSAGRSARPPDSPGSGRAAAPGFRRTGRARRACRGRTRLLRSRRRSGAAPPRSRRRR